jgi:hypothetical protein
MGNLFAVAAWHADKACQAYLSGEFDIFTRHIVICDRLRRRAYRMRSAAR